MTLNFGWVKMVKYKIIYEHNGILNCQILECSYCDMYHDCEIIFRAGIRNIIYLYIIEHEFNGKAYIEEMNNIIDNMWRK